MLEPPANCFSSVFSLVLTNMDTGLECGSFHELDFNFTFQSQQKNIWAKNLFLLFARTSQSLFGIPRRLLLWNVNWQLNDHNEEIFFTRVILTYPQVTLEKIFRCKELALRHQSIKCCETIDNRFHYGAVVSFSLDDSFGLQSIYNFVKSFHKVKWLFYCSNEERCHAQFQPHSQQREKECWR